MRRHEQTEVLVVGAGPVGMFTALRLAENGIRVQLIDQESGTAGRSYACALHPRTLQLMNEAGIAQDAIKLGRRMDKLAFYDSTIRRAELDFSRLPVEFPFVLALEQSALEDLLAAKLRERAGLEIRWNHRLADLTLADDGVTATIDEMDMSGKGYVIPDFEMEVKKTISDRAVFVVGTDGLGSVVRQRLNLDFQCAGGPQLFVLYDFETDELPSEAKIVLNQHTAGALWPFPGNKARWCFQWLPADEPPDDLPEKVRTRLLVAEAPGPGKPWHRHLQKLLDERAPWFHGRIQDIVWAEDMPCEHRLARRFGRDRAWLAGDAAHQTGPIAMQSMNLGLAEAADLAAKLTQILRENGSPDLLETYNLEHRLEWEQLLGWKNGPQPGATTNEWVREHSANLPACIPASGQELALLLRQLGLEFEPATPQFTNASL
ncbi:MAG: putative Monooxygenase FAD-binding protein [Pedosphaera sp.]|nr:putative Monooxygenase FAD-binding protein [Pedosphaera sp.]